MLKKKAVFILSLGIMLGTCIGISSTVLAEKDKADTVSDSCELITGFFPVDIKEHQMQGVYQAIFALAVFEHFSDHDLRRSAAVIARMLSPEGRMIITVPHPFVDKILDMLILCRLIEGQAVEEHHSFDPKELLTYFSGYLRLAR